MNKRVSICSVGDLMICDSPLYSSVGVGSRYGNNIEEIISNCESAFQEADLVIGNFETVVYQPKNNSLTENQMNCSKGVLKQLAEKGFSVLNLANNHCMQHGVTGYKKTLEACEGNDIKAIGSNGQEPYIKLINGIEFAFLSLCIHLEWYEPNHIMYEKDIQNVLCEVKELRQSNKDIVIVLSVHWGDEFAEYPSNAQIKLAHLFVDNGVNLILGHHSHVFQGIERYNSGLIAYSQGNFVSDMVADICRETGVLVIDVREDGDHNLLSYRLIPYYINEKYVLEHSDGNWIQHRQEKLIEALEGRCSDDEYWTMITRNHIVAHNEFKHFFINNLMRYKISASSKMMFDFIGRKVKRIMGTSSDGRVSSMDQEIYNVIEQL